VRSHRQQTLIDAAPEAVWSLVGDPNRYPEWAGFALAVTGLPEVEQGAEYEQTTRGPMTGTSTTVFQVDQLEELHEIRLRCTRTGWYSRFLLTEAQGGTFVDAEFGIEPTAVQYRLLFGAVGRRHFTSVATRSLDGLRDAVEGKPSR
jgi:uncharacterized protein YndB with AHSA1/START domain